MVIDGLIGTERNPAVLSAISVTELLVRPLAAGPRHAAMMRSFLLGFHGLAIRSVDFLVGAEAARIRAATGVTTPDALIAATATLTSSRWLITNDRVLRDRLAGHSWATTVMLLSDLS